MVRMITIECCDGGEVQADFDLLNVEECTYFQELADTEGGNYETPFPIPIKWGTTKNVQMIVDWFENHKDDPPLPPKEDEPHPNPRPADWTDADPPMPGVDEPHVPMEDNWVNRMLVKNNDYDKKFCDEKFDDGTLYELMECAKFCFMNKFSDMCTRYMRDKIVSIKTDKELIDVLGLTDGEGNKLPVRPDTEWK